MLEEKTLKFGDIVFKAVVTDVILAGVVVAIDANTGAAVLAQVGTFEAGLLRYEPDTQTHTPFHKQPRREEKREDG